MRNKIKGIYFKFGGYFMKEIPFNSRSENWEKPALFETRNVGRGQ